MKPVRLLALLEANTVTGPAKNLFQFACIARSGTAGPPVEVAVALFRRDGAPDFVTGVLEQSSIPRYTIAESGRFDWRVLEQIRSAVGDFQATVVQSHGVKSHFLVRLAGLRRMAPWVAFHHGYTWPDLRMRCYNQIDRWSLRGAAKVLTVSSPFREELILRGVDPGRIEIVHNAIDPLWGWRERTPEARQAQRSRMGIGADRKVAVIVGRLSREKDHATLLRALRRLVLIAPDEASTPHVVIVGDGAERRALEEMAYSLEIAGNVTFAGQAQSAEPFYGMADAAVLCSQSEGSPNALLEAMAARIPVVATAVGGVPEIVSHGESALLTEPGDSEGLAGALRTVLYDEAIGQRLAERAYERILAHHTPAYRTERLAQMYRRVLDEARQPGGEDGR
jgi:glycosyltransferase involved in cell wall biosynthesis